MASFDIGLLSKLTKNNDKRVEYLLSAIDAAQNAGRVIWSSCGVTGQVSLKQFLHVLGIQVKAKKRNLRDVFIMIKEAFHQDKSISSKSCSSDLVTETDQKVETYLTNFFKEKFPDHCFIGEESVADGKSCELTDKPTWIVDPIDGTTNFVHRFPFVAVSIGLAINKQVAVASVEEGKLGEVFTKAYQMAFLCKLYGLSLFTIEVGVIYGPILDKLYFAVRGEGAFCGNDRLHVSGQTDLSHALIISEWGSDRGSGILTTKANNMKNVVGRPEGPAHGMRSLGSAAWNMCMVACGSSDIYFECGIHCWDMAAGLVLIQEAGGVLTNTKGGEFDLMARNVICGSSKELVEQVAKLITHIDLPKD